MKLLVLSALVLAACAPKAMLLPEVDLSGMRVHPTITVGPIHAKKPALDVSRPFAEALADTGLFTRVEVVPSPAAADRVLVGTVTVHCSKYMRNPSQPAVIVISLLVVPTLFMCPTVLGWSQGQLCTTDANLVLVQGGRPWRRYKERGQVIVPNADLRAVFRGVARRVGARVALDLDGRGR